VAFPSRPPAVPAPSPLAEVFLEFEDSEPEACKLLKPFKKDLSPGELEVRARREYPTSSADQRARIVARAVELVELAHSAGNGKKAATQTTGPATFPPDPRERLQRIVSEAVRDDPEMTIERGRRLVSAEVGINVSKTTFYESYWKPALQLLPADVRARREQLTARQPGGRGKARMSDRQRKQTRLLVSELKRDHPAMPAAEMMAVASERIGFPFGDPLSFKRHHVDPVDPAPPVPRRKPARSSAGRHVPERAAEAPPPRPDADSPTMGPAGIAASADPAFLAWLNPLAPAHLDSRDDGLVHLVIDSGPLPRKTAFLRMAAIYNALAEAERGVQGEAPA